MCYKSMSKRWLVGRGGAYYCCYYYYYYHYYYYYYFIPIAASRSTSRQVCGSALHRCFESTTPLGQVPLRIAANLRPTHLSRDRAAGHGITRIGVQIWRFIVCDPEKQCTSTTAIDHFIVHVVWPASAIELCTAKMLYVQVALEGTLSGRLRLTAPCADTAAFMTAARTGVFSECRHPLEQES